VVKLCSNKALAGLNTLALEASARAFVKVQSDDELREALGWAAENAEDVLVLGGGSNIVLAADVTGLLVLQASRGIDIIEEADDSVLLRVAAGESWHGLVDWTLKQGFYGLENLALIPGTVGAAPIQNIGAYGVELKALVEAVHGLRVKDGGAVTFSAAECEFAYRDSIFKHRLRDQIAITAVDLRLSKTPHLQTSYPTLAQALENFQTEKLTARDVFNAVVTIRSEKLPDPHEVPNAGSFFKNPVLDAQKAALLQAKFPEIPSYPGPDGEVKFPAAWFIDHCGWKGYEGDGVGVHPEHALVLVNSGSNSGTALLDLAGAIAESVSAAFGIELVIEPRVYGTGCE
jgi:UDP-N-acetylmuramate dehydrogenase